LGLAALYLRRCETSRALDYYLEALELKPNNRIAKKALKLIRRNAGIPDGLTTWLEAGKLPSVFPPVAFPGLTAKEKFCVFAVILALAVSAFGVMVRLKYLPNPFNPRGERQGVTGGSLTYEERLEPVQTGGSYRYEFTRVQAVETYEKALSLFAAYRDEPARVNLNRILESNAAEGLKNKARIVIDFMKPPYRDPPTFDTFRRGDNISFQEAEKDPVLYRDVHVIWQGRAANVSITDSGTTFDLLVDYDPSNKTSIWGGTAFVVFNHAILLNPGRQLEVLGRVTPSGIDGKINLEGIAIHQSGRLEEIRN
jgi:hypothetical protein